MKRGDLERKEWLRLRGTAFTVETALILFTEPSFQKTSKKSLEFCQTARGPL